MYHLRYFAQALGSIVLAYAARQYETHQAYLSRQGGLMTTEYDFDRHRFVTSLLERAAVATARPTNWAGVPSLDHDNPLLRTGARLARAAQYDGRHDLAAAAAAYRDAATSPLWSTVYRYPRWDWHHEVVQPGHGAGLTAHGYTT